MNSMKTQSIGFLIFDGFPMACLTSMIEPLRAANEISGKEAFSWTLVAETDEKVRSSAGVSFEPDVILSQSSGVECLILLSPPLGAFENPKAGFGTLRNLERHGVVLGGVSGGVFPLVRAGLMRGDGVRQSIPTYSQSTTDATLPSVVAKAIAIFAANLTEPISVARVAVEVGVSSRQIERSFKKATDKSPSHYYRAMRMKAAQQLVMYSKDTMAQIALQVGYGSTTPMVQHYKEAFGLSPQEDRRRINLFRVQDNSPVPSI
jgi:transcriptional regulator GlxA family with amidase domain